MSESQTTPPAKSNRFSLKRLALFSAGIVVLLLVSAVALGLFARGQLLASLAVLDGSEPVSCLSQAASIERDDAGVPIITAEDREDLACALGFLHAQERFFQMDLQRRQAAGELAALIGSPGIESDKSVRLHRSRERATEALHKLPPKQRAVLSRYTAGVNIGLRALDAPPPEYLALRTQPEAWVDEDIVLTIMAMYHSLQGGNAWREWNKSLLTPALSDEVMAFLTPRGNSWDASLYGDQPERLSPPSVEVLDLRSELARLRQKSEELPAAASAWSDEFFAPLFVGSNSWAVNGTRTSDGTAWIANDMHLGLGLPNIWFRAIMRHGPNGQTRQLAGTTLPGSPILVTGSNGRVAWGFTNTEGDWQDLVRVEVDPDNVNRYQTPAGWEEFESYDEVIEVKDGDSVIHPVRWTVWGPVVRVAPDGTPLALRWVAHDTERGINASLLKLESVDSVEEAIAVAPFVGIPHQNLTLADDSGSIAWTIIGAIPKRFGHDGVLPTSWSDGSAGWEGWLEPADYPSQLDPASGQIWTANNRVVSLEDEWKMGDGSYDQGARAGQIRDGLTAMGQNVTPENLLAIQLDDRALFWERWRELLLELLDRDRGDGDDSRKELQDWVANRWEGRATPESVSFRLVRAFRMEALQAISEPINEYIQRNQQNVTWSSATNMSEGPAWTLLTEQPQHWLDPKFESWEELLQHAIEELLTYFREERGIALSEATWGSINRVRLQHPLSQAVPQLAPYLDIPIESLPGTNNMPRVQAPGFGASQRSVISPGLEERSFYHQPGGQSGHPFSDYYRAGHRDWVEGNPSPLLPGKLVHRLELLPEP